MAKKKKHKFWEDMCWFDQNLADLQACLKPVHSLRLFTQRSEGRLARMEAFSDIFEEDISRLSFSKSTYISLLPKFPWAFFSFLNFLAS